MTTCYKCDKPPRERWCRTEWWPVWFSAQKIDIYLNPHVTGLFKLSSAQDKRISFRSAILLLFGLMDWYGSFCFFSEGIFSPLIQSEGKRMLWLFELWPSQTGIIPFNAPIRGSISLKCVWSLTFLNKTGGSLQLGIGGVQFLCFWCWQHSEPVLRSHLSYVYGHVSVRLETLAYVCLLQFSLLISSI